jgi:hypothetical protein
MNPLTELVVGASLIALAILTLAGVRELRRLRQAVEELLKRRSPKWPTPSGPSHLTRVLGERFGGYAIYIYRDDRWHLEADFTQPGFETTPPTIPGQFEGQVVKRDSTSRKLEP